MSVRGATDAFSRSPLSLAFRPFIRPTLKGSSGSSAVDHPRDHDDLANAVCGVLVNLIADRRPALVRPADMAAPAHLGAYQPPLKAAYIVSVLAVDERGMAAYVIAAQDQASPNVLFICDFTVEPMSRTVFSPLARRWMNWSSGVGPPMAYRYLCAMTWWRKRVMRGCGRSRSRKSFARRRGYLVPLRT
jgi:hypothetical protein